LSVKRYLIVIEETGTGYSSYSPDLPGCVSTGGNRVVVEANMREAIQLHLHGLRDAAYEVPEPRSYATYVEVPA
jgi:predicted RNase H-like HicB family nuclease